MNLHKIRLQLTAMFAALAALAVGLLAWIAISTGTDQITDSAEREAETIVRELALSSLWPPEKSEDGARPFNTWRVSPEGEWRNPFGDTWIEPPLFTIAESALKNDGPTYSDFESDGAWLAYAEPVEQDDHVIVTTIDLGGYEQDQRSFRFRVVLAALAAIIATTAAAWWISGRALKPTRSAMAQSFGRRRATHFLGTVKHLRTNKRSPRS